MVIKDMIVSFLSNKRLIGYHHILLVQSDSSIHHLLGHLNGQLASQAVLTMIHPKASRNIRTAWAYSLK